MRRVLIWGLPVIAVLLGWFFAGERLDLRVLLAGLITLVSVFLISQGTGKKPTAGKQEKQAA